MMELDSLREMHAVLDDDQSSPKRKAWDPPDPQPLYGVCSGRRKPRVTLLIPSLDPLQGSAWWLSWVKI